MKKPRTRVWFVKPSRCERCDSHRDHLVSDALGARWWKCMWCGHMSRKRRVARGGAR